MSKTEKTTPHRILHTMLRVSDLSASLDFYVGTLGMSLLRLQDFPEGRFTLAFVGYGEEDHDAVLELTHNWDQQTYQHGTRFGHIALAVEAMERVWGAVLASNIEVMRAPSQMSFKSADGARPDMIAFIRDPDGYSIELIERA